MLTLFMLQTQITSMKSVCTWNWSGSKLSLKRNVINKFWAAKIVDFCGLVTPLPQNQLKLSKYTEISRIYEQNCTVTIHLSNANFSHSIHNVNYIVPQVHVKCQVNLIKVLMKILSSVIWFGMHVARNQIRNTKILFPIYQQHQKSFIPLIIFLISIINFY